MKTVTNRFGDGFETTIIRLFLAHCVRHQFFETRPARGMSAPPAEDPWNARNEAEFLRLSIENAKLYVQLQQVKSSISSSAACRECVRAGSSLLICVSVVEFTQSARLVDPLLPGWKGINPFKDSRGRGSSDVSNCAHLTKQGIIHRSLLLHLILLVTLLLHRPRLHLFLPCHNPRHARCY